MERKWVIVAVGDIRGFGSWTHRAAVTREIQEPFIEAFYRAMVAYVKVNLDTQFKYLGDGFQVVKEFDEQERNGAAAEFLQDLRSLVKGARQAVRDCGEPPPDGFRIRIFSGFVYKLMVLDPNDPKRERVIAEYIDYAINTAHRLLQVNPEISCLCDGKLVHALGSRWSIFRVRPLGTPSCYPVGVDREDVDGLKVVAV